MIEFAEEQLTKNIFRLDQDLAALDQSDDDETDAADSGMGSVANDAASDNEIEQ